MFCATAESWTHPVASRDIQSYHVSAILQMPETDGPGLIIPNHSKPFILHTDWSKGAIGAVLSQISDDNLEHPDAFRPSGADLPGEEVRTH